jgi:tetratricopeptide (TPR) repeat protein
VRNKEFGAARTYFSKAQQKFPDNRNKFLQAVAIIKEANENHQKPETRLQMAKDAKRVVNTVMDKHPKDYSVMYYRGLLNLYLQCFYEAINDFTTVIDMDEDTAAKYYLGRGRCYACLSMFKEAITDLSIAINIDKDLIDAYLNRGKCAYLIGDTSLAFMDFQKIIVLQPKNPMVHVYAGNLLMTTGSYEDATKAFSNADNIKKSPLALYQRSRCYVALTKTKDAISDLNKVVELSPNDKVARNDRDCLKCLGSCVGAEINSTTFEKSIVILTQLINYDKNVGFLKQLHHSSIIYHHSQIIPNSNRTKVDKIRTLRQMRDRRMRSGDIEDDSTFEDEEFDLDVEIHDIGEIDEQSVTKEENYYKENIFNREDYFLYRAIMYFYVGEYDKAIADFDQTSKIMHANKNLVKTKNNFRVDEEDKEFEKVSNASSQTDLSDVGL